MGDLAFNYAAYFGRKLAMFLGLTMEQTDEIRYYRTALGVAFGFFMLFMTALVGGIGVISLITLNVDLFIELLMHLHWFAWYGGWVCVIIITLMWMKDAKDPTW